jgi:glycosyltransferase involved in cell wall biosynthesis
MSTVTVVIPHYDQPQYLDECLRSLLAQTFQDWEAIVVDDVSTMGDTGQTISRLGDKRIRLIRHEYNRGLGAARNTGFRAASSPFILPVDADDCLHPEFLEATVHILLEHPEVDCVHTEFQLFGNSSQIWRFEIRSPREMLEEQWIPGPGTLMRKSLWSSIGGYSEVPELIGNDDWEFWIRAIRHKITPIKLSRALYLYRRHSDSMSVTGLQDRDYQTREIIYRLHKDFFDQYNAGAQFISEGYLNSSVASLRRGKRLRAFWLSLRGVLVDPRSRHLNRQLVRSLTPEWLLQALRPFRGRVSAG